MTDNTPPPSAPEKTLLTVPMAIIIAGGLVALAVYFSSGAKGPSLSENSAATNTPAAQPNQPSGPTVGSFRAIDDSDHVRGAANAKVTIVEYSDLECPFCKRFHETMQQVMAAYPDDVRWVYRHFPLTQLHSKADEEANAAECAGEQGKFWEFIDVVFATTPANNGLDLATLPDLAKQAGVADIAQFQSCVDGSKYMERVNADVADAGVAGGRGTPYSLVLAEGKDPLPINGAQQLEQVKATIDSLLK